MCPNDNHDQGTGRPRPQVASLVFAPETRRAAIFDDVGRSISDFLRPEKLRLQEASAMGQNPKFHPPSEHPNPTID